MITFLMTQAIFIMFKGVIVATSIEEAICNEEYAHQLQDLVRLAKIGEGNSGTVTKVFSYPNFKNAL